jgi:hypothetical protein
MSTIKADTAVATRPTTTMVNNDRKMNDNMMMPSIVLND